MAIRDILNFPDPRLRQAAAAVSIFDGALKFLADDLLDTMRAAPAYWHHRPAYQLAHAG